jgi:hypothetical protein
MARTSTAGHPTDVPVLDRPGVMHREADFHGNAKWYALEPDSPERREKGDLGLTTIKDFEPRPLSHAGSPFANLRKR